jgi:hypothetical protein
MRDFSPNYLRLRFVAESLIRDEILTIGVEISIFISRKFLFEQKVLPITGFKPFGICALCLCLVKNLFFAVFEAYV